MASGNSSLLKGAFVLLFIGAVFAGLTFLLDEAPVQKPIATTPTSTDVSDSDDPAVAEAREIGAQIGARVGEEIGRRVGETLVANLDSPMSPDTEDASDSTMVADASEPEMAEEETPVEEMVAEPQEEPSQGNEPEAAAVVTEEPEISSETMEASSETEEASMESDGMMAEAEPSHTIANEPAIPAPTPVVETEPDPSKNFVFSSSGWWNESANGKGLRIVHVGQAVSASGINQSIVVILSAPYLGSQNLEQKIRVSNASGQPVAGVWRRSANARNLFMHVDNPGTYQVSFEADLASRDGLSLGMELSGPVTIK